jgi:ADP-ribose pyrophosphatase YjhB (NUDIX family)
VPCPFRFLKGGIEVMLITSSSSKKWIIPKGHREPTMTMPECAALEAFEEAGVMGPISQRSIGTWRYGKRGAMRHVEIFPLEATEVLALWPERGLRRRRWMPLAEAADRIAYPELAEFIHGLPRIPGSPRDPGGRVRVALIPPGFSPPPMPESLTAPEVVLLFSPLSGAGAAGGAGGAPGVVVWRNDAF